MSLPSWLRTLTTGLIRSRASRPARPVRRAKTRPSLCLERLEDRCVPTAGALDLTFGGGGLVTTDFQAVGGISGIAAALQGDKILVAGKTNSAATTIDFAVGRYHADGTPDTTFGDGGAVVTAIHPNHDTVKDMVVRPDGKIVLAGWTPRGTSLSTGNLALVQYNPDGTPDTTFGDGGTVVTSQTSHTLYSEAMALQADGKIVVAGRISGSFSDFMAVRYNTDGSLDASFGDGGFATIDLGSTTDGANGVAIQADGRIILAGYAGHNGTDFAVVRLNVDGSLDASFGTGGKVLNGVGSGTVESATAVVLLPDGRITIGGKASNKVALVRYLSDGSLDPTFGNGGLAISTVSVSSLQGPGMILQPDGKILLDGGIVVTRFNANGSLDTSFGSSGSISTGLLSTFGAIQGDRILVLGTGSKLSRYNSNGSLDDGSALDSTPGDQFGVAGSVPTTVPAVSATDAGNAIALQADGKTVVVGTSGSKFAVTRYLADGTLDATFGTTGRVTTAFGSTSAAAHAVAIQADGKVVVGGTFGSNFALARYHSDGTLDTSFGTGGTVTTDFATYADGIHSLAIQSDGKIVAAGYATKSNSNSDFALARYHSNGALDSSFGSGGKVTTDLGTSKKIGQDSIQGIVLQSNGKIVVAGSSALAGAQSTFALARYNANGSLDTSFNSTGKVVTAFSTAGAWASAVVVQADGKVVAAGRAGDDFALARYTAGGSLDASFGTGGKVATDFAGGLDQIRGLALQADGKIVAAGQAGGDFALVRYNTNGSLDTAFGTGGRITTDLAGGSDGAAGVVIQADGKILLAGFSTHPDSGSDFALARYLPGDGTDPETPPPPTPTPTVSIANASVVEGSSGQVALTFTVTLSWASTDPVTINYQTVNGTATSGSDYQAASGSLIFEPGETEKTITVWVYGDTTVEEDEAFALVLSDTGGNEIGEAVGTILNDDVTSGGGKGKKK